MGSAAFKAVGSDHGSPVSARYESPFAFTGQLHEVVIQLVSPERRADLAEAAARTENARQ